jgi:ubiquitin carboxyl-terminal hydrolase 14
MGEHGVPMQQDANEFLTEILRVLQNKLPRLDNTNQSVTPISASKHASLIDQYFSGEFTCTMKCEESSEETPKISFESFLQLSCFISQDVKYLQTGLKLRLTEQLTKQSPTLGRDAVYTKTSQISRLPAYLSIQLVRFFYKEKEKVSAKILKDVKFPIMLDIYDLCTSDLQAKLNPTRECFRVQDEDVKTKRASAKQAADGDEANGKKVEEPEKSYASYSFDDDIGSNNSGYYELIGVLTHKGRSANSGHYVGWTKNQKTNEWFMFDDDQVSKVSEDEILKLSGGGDWHTAYVLFYGPRRLESKYLKA